MIPKKIHYCWFGGKPVPDEVKVYIATWRRWLPDFEIKQWNETNFDVNKYLYTRQAYYAERYAFVSDVARLFALTTEGGLYLDTDIIVKKRFPDEWFERYDAFFGFEHDTYITTGVMASEADNPILNEFLSMYDKISFFTGLKYDMTTNVDRLSSLMSRFGIRRDNIFQEINNIAVFPQIYLCGKDWLNGRYDTEETIAVHDFRGTWGRDALKSRLKFWTNMVTIILSWRLKHLTCRNQK